MHRYKDTCADIRALAVESAIDWVLELPERFLTDDCLKYFGWLLNDNEGSIRADVLKGLAKFYHNDDWHGHLQKFTKRYMSRFVELTSDLTTAASVEAIKLLTILLRNNILTESKEDKRHIEKITSLVFDKDPTIRHHACLFAYHLLTKRVSDDGKKGKKTKKKKDIKILDLVTFIRDENMALAPTYVVEGFWDHAKALKDWESITNLILSGSGNEDDDDEDEERLEEEEDVLILIRMLNTAVQQAVTRDAKKRKDKDNDDKETLVEKMSEHMAAVLPQMLAKYQAESDKVAPLIDIAKHLNLDVFTEHRLEHGFSELLKLLKAIFWKTTEPSIFRAIALTFKHLLTSKYQLIQEARTAFDEMVREMAKKLRSAQQVLNGAYEEAQKSDEYIDLRDQHYAVAIALQRIEAIIFDNDITTTDMFATINVILDNRVSTGNDDHISDTIAKIAVSIQFRKLAWLFGSVRASLTKQKSKKRKDDDDAPALDGAVRKEIEEYKQAKTKLVNNLISIIDQGNQDENSKQYSLDLQCFEHFSEIAVMSSPAVFEGVDNSVSKELANIEVDDDQVKVLCTFFGRAVAKESKKLDAKLDTDKKEAEITVQLLVAGLGKTVLYGTLPERIVAPAILSHFVAHGRVVTEFINMFLKQLRKLSTSHDHFDHELTTLKTVFGRYADSLSKESEENDEDEESSEALREQFLELVSRFHKSHFPGKDHAHIALLVRQGMLWVIEKPNVRYGFLEGLSKYANRLSPQHAKDISAQFEKSVQELKENEWGDVSDEFNTAAEEFKDALDEIGSEVQEKPKKKGKKAEAAEEEQEEEEEEPKASPPKSKASPPKSASTTPVRSRKRKSQGTKRKRTTAATDENEDEDETQVSQESEKANQDKDEDEDEEDLLNPKKKRKNA
jgi:outer membrane biosynthesis protein TonB